MNKNILLKLHRVVTKNKKLPELKNIEQFRENTNRNIGGVIKVLSKETFM